MKILEITVGDEDTHGCPPQSVSQWALFSCDNIIIKHSMVHYVHVHFVDSLHE